jgi:hypothetical protein
MLLKQPECDEMRYATSHACGLRHLVGSMKEGLPLWMP